MALKDNWTDLVDNESYIQAEDINKIAGAVIENEEKIEQAYDDIENLTLIKQEDYKWIKIDTFTTEEEAIVAKDYSSYNAKGMLVTISVPANLLTVTNKTIALVFYCAGTVLTGTWCAYNSFSISQITKAQTLRLKCVSQFGKWESQAWNSNTLNFSHDISTFGSDSSSISRNTIKFVKTNNSVPAGITFTIQALVPLNYQEQEIII